MKNLIYIFSFVLAATAMAQNNSNTAFELQKLNQAKLYGDENMIVTAMYNIITLEGPQSVYKDSLAQVYFNKRSYVSCFLVANDILKYKPDNLELLELKAISLESMGAVDKAKESYTALLAKSKNNLHAYKLAGLQFRMNENEEAYATIKKAAMLSGSDDLKVTFQVNQNYNQSVDLKAAIAYLEGLIAQSLNKDDQAKLNFEKAIQLFPEFVLAKSKLEILNKKLEEQEPAEKN